MAHRPLPVFYQVSPDDVQDLSGPFKRDFDDHKDIYTYNRVDGWIKAMQAVADLAGWHLERHRLFKLTKLLTVLVVVYIQVIVKKDKRQLIVKCLAVKNNRMLLIEVDSQCDVPFSFVYEDGKVIASVRKVLTSDFIRELVTRKPGEGQMCKR
ncbi:unnamed protein product [Linum tenue]|uniref:TIR domain-containing protein n=1 Tax=Linum tenue TaxID=586396 RepID=A0AAV0KJS0_9ROSI|nr:unnamed protein product [Linum tenue]